MTATWRVRLRQRRARYKPIIQLLSASSFEETYLSLAFAATFEPACMWTYQKIQGGRRTTLESHGMHAHAAGVLHEA